MVPQKVILDSQDFEVFSEITQGNFSIFIMGTSGTTVRMKHNFQVSSMDSESPSNKLFSLSLLKATLILLSLWLYASKMALNDQNSLPVGA